MPKKIHKKKVRTVKHVKKVEVPVKPSPKSNPFKTAVSWLMGIHGKGLANPCHGG
jgi:hypothetical protein